MVSFPFSLGRKTHFNLFSTNEARFLAAIRGITVNNAKSFKME